MTQDANNQLFLSDYANLRADVHVLKGDINNIEKLVSRLDVAIDKMSDISSSVTKLLAVHDSKIESHGRMIDEIIETVDRRRSETDEKTNEINIRLSDLREELRNSREAHKKEIIAEMNFLFEKNSLSLDKYAENNNSNIAELSDRVGALEKWRWVIVGACLAIAATASKMSWLTAITGT